MEEPHGDIAQEIADLVGEAVRNELANLPQVQFPDTQKVEVTNAKDPVVNVNVPDVHVPEIKLPTINVPKSEVSVQLPEIPENVSSNALLTEIRELLKDTPKPSNEDIVEALKEQGESIIEAYKKHKVVYGGSGGIASYIYNASSVAINPSTEEKQDTIIANQLGITSTNNTTTTPLASGATYTGTGEQNNYPQVLVYCISDTSGTLFFDWSNDGVTYYPFPVAGISVSANIPKYWPAVKGGRYFRVRFVNSASTQSSFNLTTYFGHDFIPSVSALGISWNKDDPAQLVRVGSDHSLDISRGFAGGQSGVSKFGSNPNVSSSSTEDIIFQGTINWLQAATTVRVKAGNTNDTAAGSGAQQVIVEGLDENWEEQTETLVTNGTSAGTAGSITFIRLNRAYVGNVGTYSGANAGNVTIENSSGGTDLLTIEAGVGQTQSSVYTVPAGKTAYLTRMRVSSTSAKASDISMWQRRSADDVSTPFTGKRLVRRFNGVSGSIGFDFTSYPSFPAKTDLWGSITTGSGATGAGSLAYDLILVDD